MPPTIAFGVTVSPQSQPDPAPATSPPPCVLDTQEACNLHPCGMCGQPYCLTCDGDAIEPSSCMELMRPGQCGWCANNQPERSTTSESVAALYSSECAVDISHTSRVQCVLDVCSGCAKAFCLVCDDHSFGCHQCGESTCGPCRTRFNASPGQCDNGCAANIES